MKPKKTKLFTMRVSEEWIEALRAAAEEEGRSMASYLLRVSGIYEDEKGIVRIKEESR